MTRKLAIIGFVLFGAMFGSLLQMQWDLRQMRGQLNILHGDLVQARTDFLTAQALAKRN